MAQENLNGNVMDQQLENPANDEVMNEPVQENGAAQGDGGRSINPNGAAQSQRDGSRPINPNGAGGAGDPSAVMLEAVTALTHRLLQLETSATKSSSTSAKIQAPKNYAVNQNFRIWLERFNTFADLANISRTQRKQQLLSRLENQAYVAVNNLHLSEEISYEEFCTAAIGRFHHITKEDYKLQLKSRVQAGSESFEAYADVLQELAFNAFPSGCHEWQDDTAKDQFLVGIRVSETIRQQLAMSSPKNLGEAVRKVRQLQAAQMLLQQGASQNTDKASKPKNQVSIAAAQSSTSSSSSEMTKILDLLEKMDNRISNLETTSTQSEKSSGGQKKDGPCWRCSNSGHVPSRCPTLECYNCHAHGHLSRFCPQKSGNASSGSSRGRQTPSHQ